MTKHAKDRTGLKARAAFRKTAISEAAYGGVFRGKGRNSHAAREQRSHIFARPGRYSFAPRKCPALSTRSKRAALISLISFDCFSKGEVGDRR